jgi:hypothetical protein
MVVVWKLRKNFVISVKPLTILAYLIEWLDADVLPRGAVNEKREVSGHLSPPQRCRCI